VRDRVIALLALLGAPLWLVAAWPGRFSAKARVLAETCWALAALGLVASLVRELWWARVRSRRIQALHPLPTLRRELDDACASAADEQD
jgi:hypothetical protein